MRTVRTGLDLWGNPLPPPPPKTQPAKGYAATPGTGPEGETCGSCSHRYVKQTRRRFHKCDLVRASGCRASDVLLKAKACFRWESVKGGAL